MTPEEVEALVEDEDEGEDNEGAEGQENQENKAEGTGAGEVVKVPGKRGRKPKNQ
jgi:hypothetical protein